AGKRAVGGDSNQNHLAPGNVLTSMLKRVDVAAYQTMKDAMSGSFETGVRVLGLAEGGVGWAQDDNNAKLISADMKAKIDQAGADIVGGKVKVHDYQSDSNCPY
ncbi:MAG: BMP family lipoprotein, partial [Aestuariivirgaceae bacterium]